MKPINLALLALPLLAYSSCLDDDGMELSDDYVSTFEACWQTFDQRYCFFSEKGIDWDKVHDAYLPYVRDSVDSQVKLFTVLDNMLDILKDGHVNIYAPFNVSRYSAWYDDYPLNYDGNLVEQYYLGKNYWIAAGMQYTRFGRDSVAYIRYSSFNSAVGASNLDYVLAALHNSNGLIIDVRNNGGGSLDNVSAIACRFATEKTLCGYIRHKTGTGHNEFSAPQPIYVEPAPDRMTWDASERPVVILTNRHCYSAANNFVQTMSALDGTMTVDSLGVSHPKLIKLCGDRTGGGGGLPMESVLPNGWVVRFSACPIMDAQGQSTETGISPTEDLRIDMDSLSAYNDHKDDIIEAARTYILKNTRVERKKEDNDEKKP